MPSTIDSIARVLSGLRCAFTLSLMTLFLNATCEELSQVIIGLTVVAVCRYNEGLTVITDLIHVCIPIRVLFVWLMQFKFINAYFTDVIIIFS